MKSTFRLFIGCIALFALLSFRSDKQASTSDQKHGNLAGAHTLSTITLSFINNSGTGGTIYLVNYATGQDYMLYSVNGANGYLYDLPEGDYSFYFNPVYKDDWNYYTIGCNPEFETKGEVWVDEVTFNSTCNTIYAN
jgi:hypothetical protein